MRLMKAAVYTKYGSPDVLQFKDVEKPTPEEKVKTTIFNTPYDKLVSKIPY